MFHLSRKNSGEAAEEFRAVVDVAEKHPSVHKDEHAEVALTRSKNNLRVVVGVGDAPSLMSIRWMVEDATCAEDWEGILRWESHLEEMLAMNEHASPRLFMAFAWANYEQGDFGKAASLFQRRAQLLGKMERFRDQGAEMCKAGDCFVHLHDATAAETCFQKARALGRSHGFFQSECGAINPNP